MGRRCEIIPTDGSGLAQTVPHAVRAAMKVGGLSQFETGVAISDRIRSPIGGVAGSRILVVTDARLTVLRPLKKCYCTHQRLVNTGRRFFFNESWL